MSTEPDLEVIKMAIEQCVQECAAAGYVVTVEQQPLLPLSMGHHTHKVTVRRARNVYNARGHENG